MFDVLHRVRGEVCSMFTNIWMFAFFQIPFWEGVPEVTRGNHLRREVKGGVLLTSPIV